MFEFSVGVPPGVRLLVVGSNRKGSRGDARCRAILIGSRHRSDEPSRVAGIRPARTAFTALVARPQGTPSLLGRPGRARIRVCRGFARASVRPPSSAPSGRRAATRHPIAGLMPVCGDRDRQSGPRHPARRPATLGCNGRRCRPGSPVERAERGPGASGPATGSRSRTGAPTHPITGSSRERRGFAYSRAGVLPGSSGRRDPLDGMGFLGEPLQARSPPILGTPAVRIGASPTRTVGRARYLPPRTAVRQTHAGAAPWISGRRHPPGPRQPRKRRKGPVVGTDEPSSSARRELEPGADGRQAKSEACPVGTGCPRFPASRGSPPCRVPWANLARAVPECGAGLPASGHSLE